MEPLSRSGGIVDTDVLIDVSRQHSDAVAFLNRLRADGAAHISVVSAMELVAGARDSSDLRRLRQFIGQFPALNITAARCRIAYRLMVAYGLSHGMRMPDALIAATALDADMALYTKNTRHFQMIPDLRLARPYR